MASDKTSGAQPAQESGNRLLSGLTRDDLMLLGRTRRVVLPRSQMLHDRHRKSEVIHFPLTCAISFVQVMQDGRSVEAALVGNEGVAGLCAAVTGGRTVGRMLVQVPGEAIEVGARALRQAACESATLNDRLQRYNWALLAQVAQSAACNCLHSVTQRCARWLLMAHDRAQADKFSLTQESLGETLGARRSTVTASAGVLQRAGLIRWHRGAVTVLDRGGLETVSCECYRAALSDYDRLLGVTSRAERSA